MSLVFKLYLALAAWGLGPEPVEIERKPLGTISITVARVDLKLADVRLYWRKADGSAYRTLGAVREALGPNFLLATNSGIYGVDQKPVGLHVERGQRLHAISHNQTPGGNFTLLPNGVFFISQGRAHVVETSEYDEASAPDFATQSGPLLVHNNELHPQFQKDSVNRKLRSGVGVDRQGRVVFAISSAGVSFYDFAEFFRHDLDCPNALYLDGTISQMLIGSDPATPSFTDFVGIWGVTKARPPPAR